MTYERLMGTPLPTADLLFDNSLYDLKWDGTRTSSADDDVPRLPTQDFAFHLINSVKFHCGQLFHLFDEEDFMHQFSRFHENPTDYARESPLWYVHYLLILAFGKAFVNQSARSQRPPGGDLFVYAMRGLPDLAFLDADPLQKAQVLCCIALYFQCINRRTSAYRTVSDRSLRSERVDANHLDWPSAPNCSGAWYVYGDAQPVS